MSETGYMPHLRRKLENINSDSGMKLENVNDLAEDLKMAMAEIDVRIETIQRLQAECDRKAELQNIKTGEEAWHMYQLGQVSADHSAKEVFVELIQQLTNKIQSLEAQLEERIKEAALWLETYRELREKLAERDARIVELEHELEPHPLGSFDRP